MSLVVQKRQNGRHACERCRAAKARCVTDTFEEHGKCRKCQAAGVPCEWKAIAKTRNRKRTDVRVSELEKQLSSLTAVLNCQINTMGTEPSTTEAAEAEIDIAQPSPATAPIASAPVSSSASYPGSSHEDVDIRENTAAHLSQAASISSRHPSSAVSSPIHSQYHFLSADSKKKAIDAFTLYLLPQCPVVAVPADLELAQLEVSKPFMTTAIIAAGCSISKPASFATMHHQNVVELSQAVMVEGHKSLDLVQALLISSIWSHPPENLSNLNIYQWTHMACTMALELGLGGRASVHASQQDVTAFSQDASNANMERYRTMFGVYIMCSRLSISLRRQRMISFSYSTSTAVNLFQQHAQSINDHRLVAWLRLQSIAENIESMKQNAEIRADPFFLDSSSVRSDISLFFDRLKTWEDTLDPTLWTEIFLDSSTVSS